LVLDAGASANSGYAAGGGDVRGYLGIGRGSLLPAAVIGIAAFAPAGMTLEGGTVRLQRTAVDVDAALAWRWRGFDLRGEVGLVWGLVRAEGVGFVSNFTSSRSELGVRLATSARLWLNTRVAPVLGVAAVVVPRPGEFVVSGLGPLGRTPRVWLTVGGGIAVRFQ
jgi:hypothetical protein